MRAIILSILFILSTAEAHLSAAYIFPHGSIAADPLHFHGNSTQERDAKIVHQACVSLGKEIMTSPPDILFIITPHAIANDVDFGIVLNSNGSGSVDTTQVTEVLNLSTPLSPKHAQKVIDTLRSSNEKVSGITAFSAADDYPLNWAEIIPLSFLGTADLPPILVWTQPTRRYTEVVEMIPELHRIGDELWNLFDSWDDNVAVIVSGDLAHTHLASGPYGYSAAAAPFDAAIGEWESALRSEALLVEAAELTDEALSCGFAGFVMLDGMINGRGFTPHMLVNRAPSYYGMSVASFV